jgi:hypothetical protein
MLQPNNDFNAATLVGSCCNFNAKEADSAKNAEKTAKKTKTALHSKYVGDV